MNAANDWRNNWFIKNIGFEILFVGSFLQETELNKAIRGAIKTGFMLAGGIAFMVTDPFDSMAMGERPVLSAIKMGGGMILDGVWKVLPIMF